MPPTNDTGYPLTVGPDKDGNHFSVEPGEDYELPEAPLSEPTEAPAEEPAPEAPSEDLGDASTQTPAQDPPAQDPPAENPPPADDEHTEGASA